MSRLTEQLEELGVQVDAQLFELSMTHRSFAYENGQIESNERLEFLGDAVLQIVVTEHIFSTYPDLAEGQLAKLRSAVVSTHALADVARGLGIGAEIRLGKGELATGGADKASILADTTEALIGAVHLSGGAEASARFVHGLIDDRITEAQTSGDYSDYKTTLQEMCAARGWEPPEYRIAGSGPDHERTFEAVAVVGGHDAGRGTAPSKKRAQQLAAAAAVDYLRALPDA